jgi:hypothetical protein
MAEIIVRDGIEYTASNYRMRYNPEFHENHGKPWTVQELVYLCSSYDGMKKADIAAALGRTHGTVLSKAYELKKSGRYEYFKNLG